MQSFVHDIVSINIGELERKTPSEEARKHGVKTDYWSRSITIKDDKGRVMDLTLFSNEEGGLDLNEGA